MRRAPKYLVIGNGRVANHFAYYLSFLRLPFSRWTRANHSVDELVPLSEQHTHILILISDDEIAKFITQHPCLLNADYLIHFSGSLVLENCFGAHPLMTFGNNLYKLSSYRQIPFILEEGGPSFEALLPGFPNEHFFISKEMKPYYHAMCVMSNNFTTLLWQKFFNELKEKLHLKKRVLYPFMQQTVENLIVKASEALTGPLVRGDHKTIESHLQALEGDPYKEVYEAFLKAYETCKPVVNNNENL